MANAQGMMGIMPLALCFLSLQPSYNTKRPLRRREGLSYQGTGHTNTIIKKVFHVTKQQIKGKKQ